MLASGFGSIAGVIVTAT
jgi:signal transduction histidine kinase